MKLDNTNIKTSLSYHQAKYAILKERMPAPNDTQQSSLSDLMPDQTNDTQSTLTEQDLSTTVAAFNGSNVNWQQATSANNPKMGVPIGYGKAIDRRPLIVGVAIIIGVLLMTMLGGVYWHYQSSYAPAATPTPSPSGSVTIPTLNTNTPIRTSTPNSERTLSDYLKQRAFTMSLKVVYNPQQIEPLNQITAYNLYRLEEQYYLEASEQGGYNILINVATGQVFTIDTQQQLILVDSGALHTMLDLYAIISDDALNKLEEKGSQSYRSIIYRTEKYPGATAFFSNNELAYLRNDYTGVITQVVAYHNYAKQELFTLPDLPIYQIDNQARKQIVEMSASEEGEKQ